MSGTLIDMEITNFGQAEANLAKSLPGYESRQPQQRLAQAIEDAIGSGQHLIAQAGTGTGKSLGYLIPAILSGKRVVVSTATKALQDQLVNKDLPFLAEHLGVPFSYAMLKGRSNYLCQAKAHAVEPGDVSSISNVLRVIEEQGIDFNFFGERDAFEGLADLEWRRLTASADECPGKKNCPFGQVCFSEAAKRNAKDAQVIVVNHALLFTDLMVRAESDGNANMLGEIDLVIFDECHEIQDYASGVFGAEFSQGSFNGLSTELRNFARSADVEDLLLGGLENLEGQVVDFFDSLVVGRLRDAHIIEREDLFVNLAQAIVDLSSILYGVKLKTRVEAKGDQKLLARRQILARRTQKTGDRFTQILSDSNLVRYVTETQRRNRTVKILKTSPIDVSEILRPLLFEQFPTILVSATVNFEYEARRLGIEEYNSLDVGTPFDYTKQARLYIPKHIPDPGARTREAWSSQAINETLDLVKHSDGRALLLFTSIKQMNNAYDVIADRVPYTVLKQGDEPNKVLAQKFMDDKHSVLFATKSFFTGVDFQGDACTLVVIDKLPFPVPTDALVEARTEKIDQAGGNSFSDFIIPEMTLPLAQGFGRLIRTRKDKGVVAILDPRILTKGYGKKILRGLPNAPVVTDIKEIERFLSV